MKKIALSACLMLSLAWILSGCGLKHDLYLPAPEEAQSSAVQPVATPAPEESKAE